VDAQADMFESVEQSGWAVIERTKMNVVAKENFLKVGIAISRNGRNGNDEAFSTVQ